MRCVLPGELVWVGAGSVGARDLRVRLLFRDQLRLLSGAADEFSTEPVHEALLAHLGERGASFWPDLVAAVAQAGGWTTTRSRCWPDCGIWFVPAWSPTTLWHRSVPWLTADRRLLRALDPALSGVRPTVPLGVRPGRSIRGSSRPFRWGSGWSFCRALWSRDLLEALLGVLSGVRLVDLSGVLPDSAVMGVLGRVRCVGRDQRRGRAVGRWSRRCENRRPPIPRPRLPKSNSCWPGTGILAREVVNAEGVEGGFAGLYPLLRLLEERGEVRRGYFVRRSRRGPVRRSGSC